MLVGGVDTLMYVTISDKFSFQMYIYIFFSHYVYVLVHGPKFHITKCHQIICLEHDLTLQTTFDNFC